MKFCIGLLTFNRIKVSSTYIPKILDSIESKNEEYEFIIADNGSRDGTVEWLKGLCDSRINKIYLNKANEGVYFYNYIFNNSQADYFFEIDDDVELPKGFDTHMLAAYKEFQEKYNLCFLSMNMSWSKGGFIDRYKTNFEEVTSSLGDQVVLIPGGHGAVIAGSCRLSSKEDWQKLGGQPEVLYGTDIPMTNKAKRLGFNNAYLKSCNGEMLNYYKADTAEYRRFKTKVFRETLEKIK